MRSFLSLPTRTKKPRQEGLTHVLDKGMGLRQIEDLLDTAADHIDIVKLGWGTGYVTQKVEDKIAAYREAGIAVCLGGTLLELAILQNRFDQCRRELQRLGLTHVELSTGVIELRADERAHYIRTLARDFVVLSEVGSKDAQRIIPAFRWIEQIQADLAAGSWRVVCEARESGTVGLYHTTGEVKAGLIEEITVHVDPARLIFEAPLRSQQAWQVQKFGSNVNLGNISTGDVIGLETIRLGLRADTMPDLFDVAAFNASRAPAPVAPTMVEAAGRGRSRCRWLRGQRPRGPPGRGRPPGGRLRPRWQPSRAARAPAPGRAGRGRPRRSGCGRGGGTGGRCRRARGVPGGRDRLPA
jgi:phosphosulfolactate synthase